MNVNLKEVFERENFDPRAFAGGRAIAFCGVTGSHNYNMATKNSDVDVKIFAFSSFDDLYDNVRFSNSLTSERLDATCHDIRSLTEQIFKANPAFMEVLFSTSIFKVSSEVQHIWRAREAIVASHKTQLFVATHATHRSKMHGLYKGTSTTQHLVDTYGYDTKAGCHAMRLLYLLDDYMRTGCYETALRLPVDSVRHYNLMSIKNNEVPLDTFLLMVDQWEAHNWDNVRRWYEAGDNPENNRWAESVREQINESLRASVAAKAFKIQ